MPQPSGVLVVPVLCALLGMSVAGGARAQVGEGASSGKAETSPAPAASAGDAGEEMLLAILRDDEARLSLGQELAPAELELLLTTTRTSPHVAARAMGAAVLAWLEPGRSLEPLLGAAADAEPRVRATAAQSLLSLGRRFDDEQRRRAVSAALLLLDDPSDEVACAAAELVGALAPSAAVDAVRARADAANNLRYGCFARVGGLPVRAVEVPALPGTPEQAAPDRPAGEGDGVPALPPAVAPPPAPPDGTWLFVGTAASAGLVAGALLPSGILPSRDVLTYAPGRTRILREEVAFPSQAGVGLVTAAALGGGAWALSSFVRPLRLDEASAVALGTGALGLAGASAQLAFGLKQGPAAYATAGGLGLGLVLSTGLAYGFELDPDDEVLAVAGLGLGGLTTGLVAFTAVPVGVAEIGDALRTDFGLGLMGVGAGVVSFGALAAGALVDVPSARAFAVLAGGALGAGAGTALGFLFVPKSEVKSRVACGIGLGGELVGITAALLVPSAWLPGGALPGGALPGGGLPVGTAVDVEAGAGGATLALGVPVLSSWVTARGAPALGATLVRARF